MTNELNKVVSHTVAEIADNIVSIDSWVNPYGLSVNFTVGNLPETNHHFLVSSHEIIEKLEKLLEVLGHKFYLETDYYQSAPDQAPTTNAKFYSQNFSYPAARGKVEIASRNRALQEVVGAIMSHGLPSPSLKPPMP